MIRTHDQMLLAQKCIGNSWKLGGFIRGEMTTTYSHFLFMARFLLC